MYSVQLVLEIHSYVRVLVIISSSTATTNTTATTASSVVINISNRYSHMTTVYQLYRCIQSLLSRRILSPSLSLSLSPIYASITIYLELSTSQTQQLSNIQAYSQHNIDNIPLFLRIVGLLVTLLYFNTD